MANIKCGHCGQAHTTVAQVRLCSVPRPAGAPLPEAHSCGRCHREIAPTEFYQALTAVGYATRCMPCAQAVNGPDWKPSLHGFQICQGGYQVSPERFAQIFG